MTGLNGGSKMKILGTNFAPVPSANEVLLAGVPCFVISATVNEIVCRPGKANGTTQAFNTAPGAPVWDATAGPAAFTGPMWPGGRGLLHTVFGKMYDWADIVYRAQNTWPAARTTPLVQYVDTDSMTGFSWNEVGGCSGVACMSRYSDFRFFCSFLPFQGQNNYVQDLTGYFIPPVDGDYTFYLRGDDQVSLYLSRDANPKNLRLVAASSSYTPPSAAFAGFFFITPGYFWNQGFAGQISAPITLRAGVPYFTRLLHSQGGGGEYLDTAIRISTKDPNFGSEAQRTLRSTPTVLVIQTTSAIVREVQARRVAQPAR